MHWSSTRKDIVTDDFILKISFCRLRKSSYSNFAYKYLSIILASDCLPVIFASLCSLWFHYLFFPSFLSFLCFFFFLSLSLSLEIQCTPVFVSLCPNLPWNRTILSTMMYNKICFLSLCLISNGYFIKVDTRLSVVIKANQRLLHLISNSLYLSRLSYLFISFLLEESNKLFLLLFIHFIYLCFSVFL